jgi:hypothetical protein
MSSSLDIVITEDEQFKEHYSDIMNKIKKKQLTEIEPTIDEITQVYDIITEYIKEKKRKIYGGYALNKLLIAKNKNLALYDELDTPDVDFYSPEPINDLVEICNRLGKAGLKEVVGQEAMHKETYSIFVNHKGPYCDISYMPNNIYSKVRFIPLEGFNVVHPWFMMIDYFRMFTDPMVSYWRLEKHFARYLKLQKTYPLPLIHKPLQIASYKDKGVSNAMNLLFDFVAAKETTLFTGFYAYNYYLYASGYHKHDKNYSFVFMPYLEVYSSDYVNDGMDLIAYIDKLPQEIKSCLTYKECYPFFQFYGYNVVIYYNDGNDEIPILYLYANNKKCLPFKEVEYVKFNNLSKDKPEPNKSLSLKIGCFDLNILHALIILVKVRVDDDNDWNDTLYKMINGYVLFRNYYFQKKKISLYDESIFQGFVVECIGESIPPDRESRLVMKARRKLGKPVKWRYEPSDSGKKPGKYVFLNSSGNQVNNKKNLRLTEENRNKKWEQDYEDEENYDDKASLNGSKSDNESSIGSDIESDDESDEESEEESDEESEDESDKESGDESD